MSVTKVIVKPHAYYDSVRLMRVSETIRKEEGIEETIVVMATDSNKRLLEAAGLAAEQFQGASHNDLIVAIVAASEEIAERAAGQVEELLRQGVTAASTRLTCRTLNSALSAMPDANLAFISVPGEYAAYETKHALERGLHVMLFSDNVPLEDEVALKQFARERGLLLMGPGCGTAIINQIGLGFANAIRRGAIGIVGASGTGIQQISVLIDRQGFGISHAIGTGGRDLSAAVGGITMLHGIDLLEDDKQTKVIVLTSKPPDPEVANKVLQKVAQSSKPVVVNFVGGEPEIVSGIGATPALTLEEASAQAIRLIKGEPRRDNSAADEDEIRRIAADEAKGLSFQQEYIRGLFSGGTLCYEAIVTLKDRLRAIYSNTPLQSHLRLRDPWISFQHTLVDLGDEEFTKGRAHPMIDPALRARRLLQEAEDPETAVVLLDFVLGYGAHPDPAGSLVEPIAQAKAKASDHGRYLSVVASVCGTERDPQGLVRSESALRDVGVVVMPSNAQASKVAGMIAQLARRS